MPGELIRGILTVVLWVGLWGITEMIIDKFAKDDTQMRFIIYILISLVAMFLLWILGVQIV